ncbi:MAG: PEP-CTERM sorting domain-containing protein [Alphaproteobacteria bacterium]|nr:PEP-CTERM sorting domain-containing protein [Alphaproteobacteria bacterium]
MSPFRTALLAALGLSLAHAASAATITFGNLTGANEDPFASYIEGGFTVTKTQGGVFKGFLFGNAVPSLFFGPGFGSATSTLTITGGQFTLAAFDYAANNGSMGYQLIGSLDGNQVLNTTGNFASTSGFATFSYGSAVLDTLAFIFTPAGTSGNIDNISLSVAETVPEPTSLALLGAGLVGLAARRRSRIA